MASAERGARVPGGARGVLEYDDFSSACLIQNVSERGFLLECLDEFVVGQRVRLTSTFGAGRTLCCTLEVRHVDGSRVGAVIVEIDAEGTQLCRELIEEHFALELRHRQQT